MTAEHYDVIIIGTGAGGGTLAHRLAPSGKRILLIERGGYLPREPENWDSREIFRKDRYLSDELWYDENGEAFKPHQQYFVGGNTKFYGAILFRLRERDFGEVRHYGGSRRRGRCRIKISSRTTRRRKGSTSCTGRRARTQPSRRGRDRSRSRRDRQRAATRGHPDGPGRASGPQRDGRRIPAAGSAGVALGPFPQPGARDNRHGHRVAPSRRAPVPAAGGPQHLKWSRRALNGSAEHCRSMRFTLPTR